MTIEDVTELLIRARDDLQFRHLLHAEPDHAMHGYDIEPSERAAIISGDAARLRQLGISEEVGQMAVAFKPTRQEPTQP